MKTKQIQQNSDTLKKINSQRLMEENPKEIKCKLKFDLLSICSMCVNAEGRIVKKTGSSDQQELCDENVQNRQSHTNK